MVGSKTCARPLGVGASGRDKLDAEVELLSDFRTVIYDQESTRLPDVLVNLIGRAVDGQGLTLCKTSEARRNKVLNRVKAHMLLLPSCRRLV